MVFKNADNLYNYVRIGKDTFPKRVILKYIQYYNIRVLTQLLIKKNCMHLKFNHCKYR